jgi:nucleoside-diphosphate-sugar epimerase
MQILITGGAGFIGQLVAKELLNDASHKVLLADVIEPPVPQGVKYPQNVRCVKADLCAKASVADLVKKDLEAVFVFHGIMSSGAEANHELGMRVNVDATRNLLDQLKTTCPGVRVIYSSSQAVYGQPLPKIVSESTVPTPESSYGAEKMICETIINDYTRRGFMNGLTLRFPTISVRPGLPTAAASSFLSGMIREPLNDQECIIPIADPDFASWLCSPKTLVWNLVYSLTMSTEKIPKHIRQINLPGIGATVQDMKDALEQVGGKEKLKFLKVQEDPALLPILHSWPTKFDNAQAYALGFKGDHSFEQAVRDYKEALTPAFTSENEHTKEMSVKTTTPAILTTPLGAA